MKMASFMGMTYKTLGELIIDEVVCPKEIMSTFIVLDGNDSYFIILSRYWIHTGEFVSSILHQRLMFWILDKIEVVETDNNYFSPEVNIFDLNFFFY